MWSFEEKLSRKIQLYFIHVCKYLNQTVRKIGEQNGKYFKGVSKKKKKTSEENGFHNSIED